MAETKPVGNGQYPLFIAIIPRHMLMQHSVEKMVQGINELERRIAENTGVRIPIALFPAGTTVQAIGLPQEEPPATSTEFI